MLWGLWRAWWSALPRLEAEERYEHALVAMVPHVKDATRQRWLNGWLRAAQERAVSDLGQSIRSLKAWFRGLGKGFQA